MSLDLFHEPWGSLRRPPEVPRFHSLLRNSEARQWNKILSSREATAFISPARQCWEGKSGKNRVRFSGRHEFRDGLFTSGTRDLPAPCARGITGPKGLRKISF
jgi:hypothetical protein